MSKLLFPFLFKRNLLNRHNIKNIYPFLEHEKFFTGAKTGEIIIWNIKDGTIIPSLLLLPCLNQNVGPLLCMTLIKMPEHELMVHSEYCLVTIHTDNRMRIWDLNDGRCISISSHDLFYNEQEIRSINPLLKESKRFVVCLGSSNKIHLIDTWKMRCFKTLEIDEDRKILNYTITSKREIVCLDDKLQYHCWDLSPLFSPEIFEYERYVFKIQETNQFLHEYIPEKKETKAFPEEISLAEDRISKCTIKDFFIAEKEQIVITLYDTKLAVCLKDFKEQENGVQHINIFVKGIRDFTQVTLIEKENARFIIARTKKGDVISINFEDIIHLWKVHTENNENEVHLNNSSYKFTKFRDFHYSSVELQPVYIIHQKFEQVSNVLDHNKEYQQYGKNIVSIDLDTAHVISFQIVEQTFNIYELSQELKKNKKKYSFIAGGETQEKIDIQEKIQKDENVLLNMKEDQRNLFLKPFITINLEKLYKIDTFKELLHPFFVNHLKVDFSKTFYPEEKITESTMAYHSKVNPIYIFGTNLGRVFLFKLFYSTLEKVYDYFVIPFDKSEINILYVRKSTLFVSSASGKLGVYQIAISDLNKASSSLQDSKMISDTLQEVDLSSSQEYQTTLVSPLKRVLRIKLLTTKGQESNEKDQSYQEFISQYRNQIALILKNNSLLTYSTDNKRVEFECKMNESSVLGVFIQPLLDYLLILNSNGNINIFSTNTGRFERTVALKQYDQLMNIPDLITKYNQHYQEHHHYSIKNEAINKYGSRIHGVLEYNSRYLKTFLLGMEKDKDKNDHNKQRTLSERLGNIEQMNSSKRENPQIAWLLHYGNDFIYASKYKRSGVAFLNFYLDTPVGYEDSLGSVAHIILIDAKTCLSKISSKKSENSKAGDEFRLSRKKSRGMTLDASNTRVTFIPFTFPWGIDKDMDEEILQSCNYRIPVFDFYHGVQGIGESFSFVLENDFKSDKNHTELQRVQNWQVSQYFTTVQALGFMLYFIIISQHDDERHLTSAIMKTVELLNHKCPTMIKDFKTISVSLLTHLCTVDDADLIASACNLIVSAILHLKDPINPQLISRLFEYIKFSVKCAENQGQNSYPIANFETVILASLSYWVCFYGSSITDQKYSGLHKEITPFCYQNINKIIEIPYCLHNPYAVSACLKLLVDGISIYTKYIVKLEDLFFNVIIIHFHYQASLDENIKASRDLTNITNPIAAKFKNILEEINKQTMDIRKLIKNMSLKALLSLGESYQKEFVFFIVKESKNIGLNMHYPSIVIEIIRSYLKKYRNRVLGELPRLVEAVLYCLDPNNPLVRKSSHKAASHCLQTIFRLFSMVSFHQQSQRFAVGCVDKTIILYDLRTAVKLKTLEGHKYPVSSLAFSNSGKYLASFSEGESSLRIWKVGGTTGFLSSVFGFSSKHIKIFDIPRQAYAKGNQVGEHNFKLEFTNDDHKIILTIDEISIFKFDVDG